MKFKKSSTFSFLLVWAVLFLVYFSSELVLRAYYIYGEGNSKEDIEAMSNKLPSFVKDVFESKKQDKKSQDLLTEALKSGDKDKIIKAYYAHAETAGGDKMYRKILDRYPKEPQSLDAFINVLSEKDKNYNLKTFLSFIQPFHKRRKARVLARIWHKVQKFSPGNKRIFLELVLKEKYINPNFAEIYDDLQSFAYRLKMSYEVDQVLEKLKAQCVIQRQQANKVLLKKTLQLRNK